MPPLHDSARWPGGRVLHDAGDVDGGADVHEHLRLAFDGRQGDWKGKLISHTSLSLFRSVGHHMCPRGRGGDQLRGRKSKERRGLPEECVHTKEKVEF